MAEYLIQSETLDEIADAINAKTGGSSAMTPAEMVTAIGSISGGGNNYAPWTASGEIEMVNEHVYTLDIPVQCPTTHVWMRFKAIESGTVENGEIIKDAVLTVHVSNKVVFDCVLSTFPVSSQSVTGSYGTFTNGPYPAINCAGYATTSKGISYTKLADVSNVTVLSNGNIRITTGFSSASSGYMYCQEGIYMKFRYEIIGVNLP